MSEVCNQDNVLEHLASLNVWKSGDTRAPHKPLLMLLALGRLGSGAGRLATFEEWAAPLAKLLEEFGPPRKVTHTEYPFWRLQADQLWEVLDGGRLTKGRGNTDPLKVSSSNSGLRVVFRNPCMRRFGEIRYSFARRQRNYLMRISRHPSTTRSSMQWGLIWNCPRIASAIPAFGRKFWKHTGTLAPFAVTA
jgi:putative restriction endonuclease